MWGSRGSHSPHCGAEVDAGRWMQAVQAAPHRRHLLCGAHSHWPHPQREPISRYIAPCRNASPSYRDTPPPIAIYQPPHHPHIARSLPLLRYPIPYRDILAPTPPLIVISHPLSLYIGPRITPISQYSAPYHDISAPISILLQYPTPNRDISAPLPPAYCKVPLSIAISNPLSRYIGSPTTPISQRPSHCCDIQPPIAIYHDTPHLPAPRTASNRRGSGRAAAAPPSKGSSEGAELRPGGAGPACGAEPIPARRRPGPSCQGAGLPSGGGATANRGGADGAPGGTIGGHMNP